MSGLRMKLTLLIVFLLKSTWLHGNPTTGADHDLHCLTDYLFTINCSLNFSPSGNSNSSYWLTFTETFSKETFVCELTNTVEGYHCSLKTIDSPSDYDYSFATFIDIDTYSILLCHNGSNGSEICELLDEEFSPSVNIKPNAPCCLTVNHSSGQYHFTWVSTYERNNLLNDLHYELQFYKRGGKHTDILNDLNSVHYSVDDERFVPDTEYAARVRSSPNMAHYKGQWSGWSAEVHWKTEPTEHGFTANMFISEVGKKVFIPLCVMVVLVLLLCYAPVRKWKQSAFIPNPAPYFDTLYNDCQGDFKSWVVTQESTAAVTKAEETLHIDTLTKCVDVQEEEQEEEEECPPQFHLQQMEGSAYSNMTIPVCDDALLGVPYAVCTMAPPLGQKCDLESLTLCPEPQSPAGDSGCWLSSNTSLEKDPPWYCNEYCTLSAFQQSGTVTAEHCVSL